MYSKMFIKMEQVKASPQQSDVWLWNTGNSVTALFYIQEIPIDNVCHGGEKTDHWD